MPLWYINVRVTHSGDKKKEDLVNEESFIEEPSQAVTTQERADDATTLADYIGYVAHTKSYAMPNSLIRAINDAYEERHQKPLGLTQKHFNFTEPVGDVDNGVFRVEVADFELKGETVDHIMLESDNEGVGYLVSFMQWDDPSGETDDDGEHELDMVFVDYE